jgi:hypothetical protein
VYNHASSHSDHLRLCTSQTSRGQECKDQGWSFSKSSDSLTASKPASPPTAQNRHWCVLKSRHPTPGCKRKVSVACWAMYGQTVTSREIKQCWDLGNTTRTGAVRARRVFPNEPPNLRVAAVGDAPADGSFRVCVCMCQSLSLFRPGAS